MEYVKFSVMDNCPRCGHWGTIKHNKKTSRYFIECPQCHVKTEEYGNILSAKLAWNCYNTDNLFMPVEEK